MNGIGTFAVWRGKIGCGLLDNLLAAPVLLPLLIFARPGVSASAAAVWLLKLALVYGLGLAAGGFTCRLPRYAAFAASVPLLLLALWLIAGAEYGDLAGWMTAAAGIYSFWRGCRMVKPEQEPSFASGYGWKALLLYLPVSVIYSLVPSLRPYALLISFTGMPAVVAALWLLNRTRIVAASLAHRAREVPPSVKRWNGLLVSVWIGLTVAAAFFDELTAWAGRLFAQAVRLLIAVAAFLLSWFPKADVDRSDQPQSPQQPLPLEPGEPSVFVLWLERILSAIVYAALAAAAAALAVCFARLLFRWVKRWIAWWIGAAEWQDGGEGADYVDEAEALRPFAEAVRTGTLASWRAWVAGKLRREPQWKDLQDNRERVRFLFRQAMLAAIARGYCCRAGETSGEVTEAMLRHGAAGEAERLRKLLLLYRKARYGKEEPISDGEVKAVMNKETES